MDTELTTKSAVPCDIASGPSSLPAIQSQLLVWAKEKLTEVQQEYQELATARDEAKLRKWKHSAIATAAKKALLRVEFYEKVVAALEAGYMLFPPINNVDVIAIRVSDPSHGAGNVESNWPNRPSYVQGAEMLPQGEGEYRDPVPSWSYYGVNIRQEKRSDGTVVAVDKHLYVPSGDLPLPTFPLVMARAQCVEVTSRAMEQKVFDEIAIYPARARRDPVIIGRIIDPKDRWRRLNFLISWRVDRRDL